MKKIILFLLSILLIFSVSGQVKKRAGVKRKFRNTEAINQELPQVFLRGKVRNADDELLIGACIILANTSKGVNTNEDGEYFFYGLPTGKITLRVSFIGYKTKSIDIYLQTGQNFFNITLDDDPVKLDPMVVTLQKREQQVLDVPAALTVVDARFLEQAGLTDPGWVAEFVPGFQLRMNGILQPSFSIRGLTTGEAAPGTQPGISIYNNNVPVGHQIGAVTELSDMDQVEVMKGPQGSLSGGNAMIGSVHYISHKPEKEFNGFISAGIGNFNGKELKSAINLPVIEKKLFTRFSGIYSSKDGYVKNTSGTPLMGKNTIGGRFSLLFLPTYNKKIELIVNYQNDNNPGVAYMSGMLPNMNGVAGPFSFVASLEKGDQLAVKRNLTDATLIFKHFYNEHFYWTSVSSWRKTDASERSDGDGSAAPALDVSDSIKTWQLFQEIRFNYSLKSKINGSSGISHRLEDARQNIGYYMNEQSMFLLYFNPAGLVNPNGTPVFVTELPPVLPGPLAGMPLPAERSERTSSGAYNQYTEAFTDATWQFLPRLSFTGGFRAVYCRLRLTGSSESTGGGESTLGLLTGNYPDLFNKPYTEKKMKKQSFAVTWRALIKYSFNENANMYFGASQGRIPPVLKFSSTGEKQIIDPEKVMCLDLGFKTAILRRIWFDAAGFYQIYSNFQASEWISSPITGRFSQLVIDNNKAVSFGAESNLKAALLKGVDLFGNFAYIHARFNKVDSSDTRFQFSGNFLRLAPEFSFSAGLSLKIRLKKVLDLFVIPAYSWKSHFWSDNANTRGIDQEAYGILNGAAGFELKSLGLSLSAFAQNILDKRYIISGGNTGSMFGIPTFVPGSPRMIGTKLTWKWLK